MEQIKENKIEEYLENEVIKRKQKINAYFSESFVVGMGLNLYTYLSVVIKYELIKVGIDTKRLNDVLTEKFLVDNFQNIFDQSYFYKDGQGNNEGKIYENFKEELLLSIIHREIYFDESKELIKKVENKYKKVMSWFSPIFEGKILYSYDSPEAFGMYELIYNEEENTVIFHIGGEKPFIFNEQTKFEDFYKQMLKTSEYKKINLDLIRNKKKEIENKLTKKQIKTLQKYFDVKNKEGALDKIGVLRETKGLITIETEDLEKKLIIEEKKIKKLINALTKIYEEHLLSERKLNIQLIEDNIIIELNEQHKIKIHPKEKSYYKKIRNQIEKTEIKTAFAKKIKNDKTKTNSDYEKTEISFENDDLDIKLTFSYEGKIKRVERRIEKKGYIYEYKNKKMKNLNEVNEFITKYKKNMGERIKNSRKNAKEFFLSNLTKKEEDFYQQNGFIEIETESNIYLLKPRSKFNINHLLIVWDKGDEELEAARCYCIEKVENQIEEYDEMASILFALKSKDYEYVEENSNKFNLTKETQAKLKERYVNANLKEEVI